MKKLVLGIITLSCIGILSFSGEKVEASENNTVAISSTVSNGNTTVTLEDDSTITLEGFQGELGTDFEIIKIEESVQSLHQRTLTRRTTFTIQSKDFV